MEYESRRYGRAFELSFNLANVTDTLVDRALRKPAPIPTAAAAAVAAAAPASSGSGGAVKDASTSSGKGKVADVAGGSEGRGGGVGEDWTAESRRIEAGEVLGRRAMAALKVRSGWRCREGVRVRGGGRG